MHTIDEEAARDSSCGDEALRDDAHTLENLDPLAKHLLDQLPALVFTVNRDLRFTSLRGGGLHALDLDPNAILGRTIQEVLGANDPDNLRTRAAMEVLSGASHSHETTYGDRTVQTFMQPQCDAEGVILGIIAVSLDVTQQKAAIRALEHTQAKLLEAQQLAGLGSYELDILTRNVWWSDNAYALLGATPGALEPSVAKWRSRVHSDDLPRYEQILDHSVATGTPFVIDHRVIRLDGEERWVHHRGDFQHDPDGCPVRLNGTILDITDRKLSEDRLSYLVHHDELTGVSNRKLFLDRLTTAVAQGKRRSSMLAVLFIDIDRLKVINDTCGHAAGGVLLRDAARRMHAALREGDTLARMGGDEFAVLLHDVRRVEDTFLTARRLLDALEEPLSDQASPSVSASIGISIYPHEGTDAELLLRHADTAMYAAKQAGGRCFQLYTPSMHDAVIERLLLESNLRAAIENDQLFLQYQPVVNASGETVRVEALVRWKHPRQGLIPPAEFIPLAEESDLIVRLGEWVLRNACRQLVAWHAKGMGGLRVAVNASARQFADDHFAALVADVLSETGLDGGFLEIEITESAFIRDIDRAIAQMRAIKTLGVSLAVDDFGMGFSSLAYLQRLPVDSLKIDRSFVAALGDSKTADAIPRAILTLGKSLGLRVVGEGVEFQCQAAALRYMGCDEMQGYHFSRPLSPADLEARARDSAARRVT